ncbi:hypothetical protein WME89_48880 [Sorangium sp. So ce321]|uniref:hypothetical protein n=1 Tax=Sorangium sp. So ce321 TaxID=3133300 RepID=UPI003F639B71
MTDGSKGGASGAMIQVTTDFEGSTLTTYVFRGRPCMVAADVGRALEYADEGKALVEVMKKQWGDELLPGKDMEVLTGEELREFKGIISLTEGTSVSRAPAITVLYESGFDLVCIKTEKPLGKKLRRHLADVVMPKLRRGETIGPAAPAASLEWSPEALVVRKADLLLKFVSLMSPAVSQEAKDAILANGSALLTGQRLAPLLPAMANDGWKRPSEIAEELGVSANAVGRAISALGFRDQPEHFKTVMDEKSGSAGQVPCYLWDRHVQEALRAHFAEKAPPKKRTAA